MNMKRIVYIYCVLALACQREKTEPESSVTGLFNGTDWATPGWSFETHLAPSFGIAGEVCSFPTYTFLILKKNPQGDARSNLHITKIPPKVGTFRVENIRPCRESEDAGAIYFVLGADGDVVRQVYHVLESETNQFFVDEYDKKGGRMRGRFQITFVVDPKLSSNTPPDTIRFTNGTFNVPITKR